MEGHLWEMSGSDGGAPLQHGERRSEVLGLGRGREEYFQAGEEQTGRRTGWGRGAWLMGGGLAGEQRVVVTEISRALQDLSLTGKAELLQGFRQGRAMPVLHFSKISSTTV